MNRFEIQILGLRLAARGALAVTGAVMILAGLLVTGWLGLEISVVVPR